MEIILGGVLGMGIWMVWSWRWMWGEGRGNMGNGEEGGSWLSYPDQYNTKESIMSIKRTLFVAAIVLAVSSVMLAFTAGPGHDHGAQAAVGSKASAIQTPGLVVAGAYIAGMEAGNLDALSALFISDEKSSILENASKEGSWEYYRDHHLAPEMEVVKNFKFEIAVESEKSFGDAILVEQVGAFSVDVNDETRDYRVAVSYLMVREGDGLRIAHLHWSSRAKR